MADLKEIKTRIQSIKSTQKITSAMMMVSSAKLLKAQRQFTKLAPYEKKLFELLRDFLSGEEMPSTPYTKKREVKRIAIVAFSSSTGLVGRFNNNIAEKLQEVVDNRKHLGKDNIVVYPVGSKIYKSALNMDVTIDDRYIKEIEQHPTYQTAETMMQQFMDLYEGGEIDRVELLYHHFKSKGTQEITLDTLFPLELETEKSEENDNIYIFEPEKEILLSQLLPKVLKLKMYTTLIDSVTSEHAARMIAMQIATDNADNLTDELTIEYNKLRQQSITNELLDMASGMTE